MQGVDILSTTAEVNDKGDLTLYKAQCKIAFLVESDEV
jgi:hypothetical protein